MRIKFNPNLEYQQEAIAAVRDIFDGQQTGASSLRIGRNPGDFRCESADGVIGNRLRLHRDGIAQNVNRIQLRNGLPPTRSLDDLHFTVEMETGTGKTYVYLRTIFELNRAYEFTKFIVVVPSVAIKEGVFKSLQITEDHFRSLYVNARCDYFVYDSQKLGLVRNFAVSDYIQIMVINIDAFRRSFANPTKEDKANIIHRPHDAMTGYRPIELIQDTHPIVIIDEPQSVDTTKKSKEAIESLNPLCTIRYSATHIDKYNMVYRLDSIDAYQRELVKQIEVASIEVEDDHNRAHVRLLEVDNARNQHKARVELDVLSRDGRVRRTIRTVRRGDELMRISGGREIYEGLVVDDIHCQVGDEYVRLVGRSQLLRIDSSDHHTSDDQVKRLQIRQTIEEHLAKELVLRPQGVKVLSLFFIDRVANYRYYDEQGRPQKGKYAVMFEEEYMTAIAKPEYRELAGEAARVDTVASLHGGYFAVDKKRDAVGNERLKESRGSGTNQADESAYQLIMRDKERLLSFATRLRFIFSHSALREGWDNPNVFQICTLNETASSVKKRQEIGRGLRIAVNQAGERVFGHDVNRLTVMANESYEQFASLLQREIEEDTGVKFGVVEPHLFANISLDDSEGDMSPLGMAASRSIWQQLRVDGYINPNGQVCDRLRIALKEQQVILPAKFTQHWPKVLQLLRKVAGSLRISKAGHRGSGDAEDVSLRPELQAILTEIRSRMTYRVDFDAGQLVNMCIEEIQQMPTIGRATLKYRKSVATIQRRRVQMDRVASTSHDLDVGEFPLPDVVSHLQEATKLTRRSVVDILLRSQRLEDFKNNPQKFIERVIKIIVRQMRLMIGDGVRYRRVDDQGVYVQELASGVALEQIRHALRSDALSVDGVKWCDRLPPDFRVDTPLGPFEPDCAVLVNVDGSDQLLLLCEPS